MNRDSEYFTGITAPGSIDYYALLFCPPDAREDFRILLAFEALINELSIKNIESDVRQAKLGWWANELSRMTSGKAVHPVSVAVTEVLNRRKLPATPLLEMFAAVAREAGAALPANPDELTEHAAQRGALLPLLAKLMVPDNTLSEASGNACVEVGGARYLAMIFGAGHGDHKRHQPTGQPDSPAPLTLEEQLANTQIEKMHEALKGIPVAERPRLIPILVWSKLVHDRLLSIRANGQDTLGSQLRRLSCAWRTARRASRGKLPV